MPTHPKCGKAWIGLRISHCSVCCETFTSEEAGDAHRVGRFTDGSRRCLTPEEMRARVVNGKPKPLVQDARGFWRVDRPRRSADSWASSVTQTAEQPSRASQVPLGGTEA